MPEQLFEWVSREDKTIKAAMRNFVRRYDVEGRNFELPRNNDLWLVLLKFAVWQSIKNLLGKQEDLDPLISKIVEWFQSSSLPMEIIMELEEFLKLYIANFDNDELQNEVSLFMFHHPTLACEFQQFVLVQNSLYGLVSKHLSN